MCKTNFTVVVFYDGTRSAKEVVNDAIASKVRRKIDNDIEIPEGKEYNQDNTQEINYPNVFCFEKEGRTDKGFSTIIK